MLDALSSVLGMIPKPFLTRDMVSMQLSDLSAPADLPGLRELGIEPTPMEEVTEYYLKRFRPPGTQQRSSLSRDAAIHTAFCSPTASQTVEEVMKRPYSA